MNVIKKTIQLSDGRTIEIETGKLAKQADGSVVVKMGKTMLLPLHAQKRQKKMLTSCLFKLSTKKNMPQRAVIRVVL
jgi:polyribonucleotide nucleotidyltransferase